MTAIVTEIERGKLGKSILSLSVGSGISTDTED
jgi:hypothetical protein